MKGIIIVIGSIVVSLFLMGIPIVTTISFIYDWGTVPKCILAMYCLIEWSVLGMLIGENVLNDG